MSFFASGTGKLVSGRPEDAFLQDFKIIPEGTVADAFIKTFELVEKDNKFSGERESYYEIVWKICSDDFKNREVHQKIKCFSGAPESIDRALNMLLLIIKLCDHKMRLQRSI